MSRVLLPLLIAMSLSAVPALAADNWSVRDGVLAFSVVEPGAQASGQFGDWSADIAYDAETQTGAVEVSIAIGSLDMGSVTGIAVGPEFFDAKAFPTAVFKGPILAEGAGLVVDGELTIREITLPLRLPLALQINGDTAQMTGTAKLNRLDYGVGETYLDPKQAGVDIQIDVTLTATRE